MNATSSGNAHIEQAARDIIHLHPTPLAQYGATPGLFSVAPPRQPLSHPLRGREDLTDRLGASLTGTTPQQGRKRVIVLHGPGGCGKSSIALELAHRALSLGFQVWWARTDGPTKISACMREVASQLGCGPRELDEAWLSGTRSAPDLVWRLLDETPIPWLLIFDNADHPELLDPEQGQVSTGTGWLRSPTSQHGMVLVTSRNGSRRTWGSMVVLRRVPMLSPEDGGHILLDLVGETAGTKEEAQALAERLGGLPLALNAAGRYLASQLAGPAWRGSRAVRSFQTYLNALDERFTNPHHSHGEELNSDQLGLELVRQTRDMSLDQLAKRGFPESRPLLRLLSCCAGSPIPYGAILNPKVISRSPMLPGLTERRLRHLLDALRDLGFVDIQAQEDIRDPTYSHVLTQHPLMHAINREDLGEDDRAFHELLIELLYDTVQALDPDSADNWRRWDMIAPHCAWPVAGYLGHRPQNTNDDHSAVVKGLTVIRLLGRYLLSVGLPAQAENFLRGIVRLEATLAKNDQITLAMLAIGHEYGRSFLEQRRSAEAEQVLRPVLDAREGMLGHEHLQTLATRHKLARAILEQGRWKDAEVELREVLHGERDGRGLEHNDTLIVRHSLAYALIQLGRADEAERELYKIISIRQRINSADHPEILKAQHSLARAYIKQGRMAEARRKLNVVLERQEQILGPDHPETVTTRTDLDKLYESHPPDHNTDTVTRPPEQH